MMKNAWRILAAVGVVAAVSAAPGCVVGSGDDESGGSGGVSGGGSGGKGGSSGGSGGVSGGTGGTSATGGTGAIGGTGATGGTGGEAGYTCAPTGSTPGSCEPAAGSTDACELCIKNKCCSEWGACIATAPNNPCGSGAPDGSGEIFCMQTCYVKETSQNGLSGDDAKAKCGNDCVSPTCGTIDDATNDAFTCLESSCLTECLSP